MKSHSRISLTLTADLGNHEITGSVSRDSPTQGGLRYVDIIITTPIFDADDMEDLMAAFLRSLPAGPDDDGGEPAPDPRQLDLVGMLREGVVA